MSGQFSEDSMFKAILKNKATKENAQSITTPEVPVEKEARETDTKTSANTGSSEDMMFNVLLKNNPSRNTQITKNNTGGSPEPLKKEDRDKIPKTNTNTGSSEDAMFRALLGNNTQKQKTQPVQNQPAKREQRDKIPKTNTNAGSSEDAMYRALLGNNTKRQIPKTPLNKNTPTGEESPKTAPEQVKQEEKPIDRTNGTQSDNIHESGEQVVKIIHASNLPVNAEIDADLIKNLTASVNMMYGLLKTVIAPVLILILVVGIVTLFKA